LVPDPVIEAMDEYYKKFPACGGLRSRHWFAAEVADRIDGSVEKGLKGSRKIIAEFINASSEKEIIFTLNTSQAINLVALGFPFQSGDVVLLTGREHNSNLVPWLRLQQRGCIKVDYILDNGKETFDLEAFERRLKGGKVRLVSMAYTSNATGYTLPAMDIVRIAHQYGARVLLDGAQTVPHGVVDVQKLNVDFLAFSLHKMCGPRGVGILYGKKELLMSSQASGDGMTETLEPVILGGGCVGDTTYHSYDLMGSPDRFEAGIQNYPGLIASGTAINYLQQIGLERIKAHEIKLNAFLTNALLARYGDGGWFNILGPSEVNQRGGILTFEVKRPNALGLSEELDQKNNIMIRDGMFCAHSYFNEKFGGGWTRPKSHSEHRMVYRVSLYFYNTLEECRVLVETLHEIFEERGYI
ncbi:MAG TPA: aminotransferase class V-fold PLP-dependent enzyme, partial [Thermodesulfobacteriota bacterium]|nr:aminotransferase class V-fold PLP-dependent enzyme [Thermodesulfobacteriota bacterium]